MPNYWVMRTDRRTQEIKDYLWDELKQGRLRQGWGYMHEQNLRTIDDMDDRSEMSEDQIATWRGNRRMLESHGDGIKPDDIILIPHLPQEGAWSIARRLSLPYKYDLDNDMGDYGHTLDVELISTTRPVNFHEEAVAAGLRSTMRNMGRLWNINHLGDEVEHIRLALTENKPADQVFNRIPLFVNEIERLAWGALQRSFKGNEFERPCVMLLEALYGEDSIEHTAGPSEKGADVICSFTDPLGIPSRVAVQIKMWDWDADSTSPLHQLRQAFESYDITSGVVMTTSEKTTDSFEEERKQLEVDLGIPIKVITRKELIKLILTHLPKLFQE